MERTVIQGNEFYEIDLECEKRKKEASQPPEEKEKKKKGTK
ncbi:MAG: hypothetical protein ACI4DZ_00235 [Oliverpabstia sp.]